MRNTSQKGIGQIIGKFKGRLGETMRLGKWTRQRDAEVGFCDFRERGCAPFTKITPAERSAEYGDADV